MNSVRRERGRILPLRVAGAAIVVGGGIAACVLLSGAGSPRPTLRILAPLPNAVLVGGAVTMSVQVENVKVNGSGFLQGDYHLHYYLDAPVPITPGQPSTTAKGTWASSTATSYRWSIVSPGPHVLAVQVVHNDDSPLNPPVTTAVIVQMKQVPSLPSSTKASPTPSRVEGGC